MKTLIFAAIGILGLVLPSPAFAVHSAEDIAITIMLRGQPCGGMTASGGMRVSDITETRDDVGNRTITATCPNGRRYRIDVSHDGRVVVTPIK
ncbi:MAG: hypothetical protein BMS9Abin18_0101 [Zetaproteobacteria bacterium]|nr:MAG: hypothetical protein BMS9Abin18_0101 [Zetaproteobacteria bacterium]